LALGLLATTERSDEIEIALPADLVPPISTALRELREAASGERAALAGDRLVGPPAALRELLAVAIEDVSEQLAGAATALMRGEAAKAATVRAHHSRMGALLDLLESVADA
jgi:hypothetical protein